MRSPGAQHRDLLIGHVAFGRPIEDAAEKVGVSMHTVDRWRTDPVYERQLCSALRVGEFFNNPQPHTNTEGSARCALS